jgi:glucosamine-6-phosphate deaminase
MEKIPTVVYKTPTQASYFVAHKIAELIKKRASENRSCVLGLATGNTPIQIYNELIRLHKQEGLSFKNVITFNLDEYYPMQPDKLQSYVRYMREYLFDHIDIPKENINIPTGTLPKEEVEDFCRKYEEKIVDVGGIDIQVLGIGRTGHIGFNEPGSTKKSKTRMVHLDKITQVDAASDFFGVEYVPKYAVTMGIGTILSAKQIYILAFSEGKASIVKKAIEGPITIDVAASFLQDHKSTTFVLDNAAAEQLIRFKCPWTLKGVSSAPKIVWTEQVIKKAVIWLSQTEKKPILRLTESDYEENGLIDLLRLETPHSASRVNIRVHRQLTPTITGWPGSGKPEKLDVPVPYGLLKSTKPKTIVIFSPHPDDDVICMGGTMIKLTSQGHTVHVVYQTSGNIAVYDHDALRFADFVTEYLKSFNLPGLKEAQELQNTVKENLKAKTAGDVDPNFVLTIKGLIRKTEARSAAMATGVKEENIHFMDLPFYETGKVKKKPMGEADITIVKNFLDKLKPDQIYAAGDLTDPHGTHRVCLEAIIEAFKIFEKESREWYNKCDIYLYRGSWQEWEPEMVKMAVPMSPEELYLKRLAIFKHQSQKDVALFPGSDSREFWQRAEERNKKTARIFDELGLQEYEALEVFVGYNELKNYLS